MLPNLLALREYQTAILETCKQKNTLVVVPTGVGKTLIALHLIIHRLKQQPGSKILFLAPTKPLVEQHYEYVHKQLPELFAERTLFTGEVKAPERKKAFQTGEIILSTPQCIANDIDKHLYSLHDVSLIVIDEAHRCLKQYDYTKVVQAYKQQALHPHILGLTASPGSDPEIVRQICEHLAIEAIELRTRESEDVKPYLKELEFTKVEVPFPKELVELKILLQRVYNHKTEELKALGVLFGPVNRITLIKLQARLALQGQGVQKFRGMSLTAQALKIAHALELVETQSLAGLKLYLDNLDTQAKEKQSKGVQQLVKQPEFRAAQLSLTQLLEKGFEHPKVEEVAVLVEQEFKENQNAKIIIFTQFRDTAEAIRNRLEKIPQARPVMFIGQAKKAGRGLSQKEQKAIIEQFKALEKNILIATSIGEEGLDIPEVNAVIFYEPVASAIRKIQRAGRTARLAPGKLIMLITKETRDEINHYSSIRKEKKMHQTIATIQKEINTQNKNTKINKFF
ncbi:DEAD/DEAH box helicase [Candidatus Pacearchaeota archaeon]|nr:DEAD/DEAH box helicase [Candidatus Pacearchaeota archaeon]